MDFQPTVKRAWLAIALAAALTLPKVTKADTFVDLDPNKLEVYCTSSSNSILYITYKESPSISQTIAQDAVPRYDCDNRKVRVRAQILAARSANKLMTVDVELPDKSYQSSKSIDGTSGQIPPTPAAGCKFVKTMASPPVSIETGCGNGIFMAPVKCTDVFEFTTVVACSGANASDATACYREFVARKQPAQANNNNGNSNVNNEGWGDSAQ